MLEEKTLVTPKDNLSEFMIYTKHEEEEVKVGNKEYPITVPLEISNPSDGNDYKQVNAVDKQVVKERLESSTKGLIGIDDTDIRVNQNSQD